MSHYPNAAISVFVTCYLAVLAANGLPSYVTLTDNLDLVKDNGISLTPVIGNFENHEREFPFILSRLKRTSEHVVTECIFMTSEEGQFFHKTTTNENTVCGIYIVAEPTQKIEIKFNYFNVPCTDGGLVAIVDGWELNGELFPSVRDYTRSAETRFKEYCDQRKIKKTFISTSNVALIQYRIPFQGYGFTVTVRFIKNPTPCNVMLQNFEEIYTLRNYERRSNCSVSTLFPSAVRIDSINVGIVRADLRSLEIETGTIHKCHKRGLDDFVQIGGSIGLDNSNMIIADSVCGLNSRGGRFEELIACGTTTVRMVSSGAYDNAVTIHLRQLNGDDDMNSYMSVVCPIEEIRRK